MTKEYIIYAKWMAYELRKKGFKILRTEPNPVKPEFDCWVFENSDELQAEITLVSQSRKGGPRK